MCAMNHLFASMARALRERVAWFAVLQVGENVREVQDAARLRRELDRARDELEAARRVSIGGQQNAEQPEHLRIVRVERERPLGGCAQTPDRRRNTDSERARHSPSTFVASSAIALRTATRARASAAPPSAAPE